MIRSTSHGSSNSRTPSMSRAFAYPNVTITLSPCANPCVNHTGDRVCATKNDVRKRHGLEREGWGCGAGGLETSGDPPGGLFGSLSRCPGVLAAVSGCFVDHSV